MQIRSYALEESLKLIKNKKPLIYCISNLLNTTELSKGILSYNGVPIVANSIEDINEKTLINQCILLNIENLDSDKLELMDKYLRVASKKKIPVVLDMMGINNSFFQKETVLRFINRYNINILKGNLQEFKTLFNEENKENVQHSEEDIIKKDLEFRIKLRDFSRRNETIVVLEKNYYYITDGFSEFYIDSKERIEDRLDINREILSGLISVGIGASSSKEQRFKSVLVAVMTMAVSQTSIQRENLYKTFKDRRKSEVLIETIENMSVGKLNKLSKIDYLFVRK